MVDGEKLMDMFEKLELGLSPRTTFEINDGFFSEYQEKDKLGVPRPALDAARE